jgi:hypothetical protein
LIMLQAPSDPEVYRWAQGTSGGLGPSAIRSPCAICDRRLRGQPGELWVVEAAAADRQTTKSSLLIGCGGSFTCAWPSSFRGGAWGVLTRNGAGDDPGLPLPKRCGRVDWCSPS